MKVVILCGGQGTRLREHTDMPIAVGFYLLAVRLLLIFDNDGLVLLPGAVRFLGNGRGGP